MPQFRYRAVTQTGEMVAGEVEAATREEVLRRIEYLGHLPIEAEVASRKTLGAASTGGVRAPARDVTIFLRQLALLVGAGLTLDAALQTLAEDASKPIQRFATGLRSMISSGESFAEALERHPHIIDPAYVAMARAGEASGKLQAVLAAIVEDRVRRELLSERVGSAIRYPLFLIGAALLVLFFFLLYVVPQFEPVFHDLGNRLNGGVAFVLAASAWLHANLYSFLAACAALALGLLYAFSRPGARAAAISAVGRVPGVAGPMQDWRTTRVIGALGLLLGNGVSLPTTLKILRDVVVEPQSVAAIDRIHEQVRSGRRFADALAETRLLPPLAVRMLRIGEETGDLPAIAAHATQFYEHRLGAGLDRLMGAIGPAAIVVVSVLVGALVTSIMSALLSITDLAQ
ncbi:general secretion pathway protein GspF [Methylosinus sp. R-45379]|uniref:type II secretion system F family protein n=1 Tax=unclassified Methylosinus TaxID=2624500 RepID=UPI000464E81B|nr:MULTISPECIES: type II secretion system F family protein [unclassified Methylosinus]OAI26225.1 general secretion pathway protein GspF [Methylosinus sp. R-45379]TDX60041.1 type II secretion system protein F (GspF) [Methylosinus sp. sav-2]